ncbi:MAG: AAA family ATPase [Gammaproteobacteria bacterium]|nr:AAA family ATPase [Gammaproteobacteria bacterium]
MSGGTDRPQPLGSVVWINGAFGAGKSTVAQRLAAALPDAAVFDPEPLARLIRDAMPPSRRPSDYQDSALWRHLTVEAVGGLAAGSGVVIVPMTLIDERYFADTVGVLRASGVHVHHFSLTASPATIRRRLLKRQVTRLMDPRSTLWALDRIERCCAALAGSTFHEQVDTDALTVTEIVDRILEHTGGF